MKKYWNLGLTTEAGRAMINFARHKLNKNTFYAKHAKENPASGKVLEKTGFIYQKDTEYKSLDGKRQFEAREYFLTSSL
jgi:ribosomal-protein-alanine N-acetyltransferase